MTVYKSKKATRDGRQYFFRIKYKDIFGEVHDYSSPKFKKQKEAEDEEAIYRVKIQNQKVCTSNITINQAFNEWHNDRASLIKKQTLYKDFNLYKHFSPIKDVKINDFNLPLYKKFRNYIDSQGLTTTYKNKILGMLKNIIRYSANIYNTSDNILKFIVNFKNTGELKKEMDFFTYEEYLKFDSVIDRFEYHVFFELLYFIGLRQGECTALTWNDIDFERSSLRINKTLTTKLKGEKWTITTPKTKSSIATMPLTEKVLNDLKILKNDAMKFKDFSNNWFVFGNTQPFRETTIQVKKNNYCKAAGVKQIRIHDFRHSCATLLINRGASIALVSKYLRHSKISTTANIYIHLYKSELDDMIKTLENL